ncbi:MAG: DNA-directed RNA polymerase subunit alpha [Chloroflexi bacterium]|nr:DNA-directed RNA polymerase subunit alpha [Chloroflexota bacterium]
MVVIAETKVEKSRPEIKVEETAAGYGRFSVGPLEQGYGMTLGNAIRRVLLSSIPGTAVTWVKIGGVTHEYSTIPHVKEQVTDLLLNFKSIRLRSLVDRPGRLRLEVKGEGVVTAGDVMSSADFEIVNPELHLATLDSPETQLSIEFNVEQGTGYVPATGESGLPIGVLPVDAIYTPVRRVNYSVERTRVGQVTDYERLILEIWTDETISPVEALAKAGHMLLDRFFLFANVGKVLEGATGLDTTPASTIPPDIYNTPVERLELSARTLNCLKRAHLNRVGEILEKERSELLKIRNFGEKSMEELADRLEHMGFLPPDAKLRNSGHPRPAAEAAAAAAAEEESSGLNGPVSANEDENDEGEV